MTITWQHISITVLIALALHGGIAMWFLLPTPESLPELPVQELRISLLAAVAETTAIAPPVTPPPPDPEPVPQVKPKPEPVPKPKPKPAPEPVIQKLAPEPQPVAEPEPPQPEPLPIEEPIEPVPVEKPIEPAETSEPIPEPAPPSLAQPTAAPLDAVATAKYEQLLVAWLEKHKKYPRRAKRLRIEGEGRLRILIDRTGRIQHVTLEQRTGNRLLNKATLEMAERADPFPAMPENDPRQEMEFIVPVVFALR